MLSGENSIRYTCRSAYQVSQISGDNKSKCKKIGATAEAAGVIWLVGVGAIGPHEWNVRAAVITNNETRVRYLEQEEGLLLTTRYYDVGVDSRRCIYLFSHHAFRQACFIPPLLPSFRHRLLDQNRYLPGHNCGVPVLHRMYHHFPHPVPSQAW